MQNDCFRLFKCRKNSKQNCKNVRKKEPLSEDDKNQGTENLLFLRVDLNYLKNSTRNSKRKYIVPEHQLPQN